MGDTPNIYTTSPLIIPTNHIFFKTSLTDKIWKKSPSIFKPVGFQIFIDFPCFSIFPHVFFLPRALGLSSNQLACRLATCRWLVTWRSRLGTRWGWISLAGVYLNMSSFNDLTKINPKIIRSHSSRSAKCSKKVLGISGWKLYQVESLQGSRVAHTKNKQKRKKKTHTHTKKNWWKCHFDPRKRHPKVLGLDSSRCPAIRFSNLPPETPDPWPFLPWLAPPAAVGGVNSDVAFSTGKIFEKSVVY